MSLWTDFSRLVLVSATVTGAYQAYSFFGAAAAGSGRLAGRLRKHGFVEKPVVPDGNCQFRALSDQLFDTEEHHRILRLRSVEWLRNNINTELDESGLHWPDFLDTAEFSTPQRYCRQMERDGAWGDHFTLMGAAEVLDCNIQVISSVPVADEDEEQYITTIAPRLRGEKESRRTLYLSHHTEQHYNSLRREGEL